MQDQVLRRIFILAGLALLLWVLYLLKPVVLPFVGAFFIAYLFSPLVDVLVKIKLPRWLAISLVLTGVTRPGSIRPRYLAGLISRMVLPA